MNWRVVPNDETGFWEIHDECGHICQLESEGVADYVVRACNSHSDLRTACGEAKDLVGRALVKHCVDGGKHVLLDLGDATVLFNHLAKAVKDAEVVA